MLGTLLGFFVLERCLRIDARPFFPQWSVVRTKRQRQFLDLSSQWKLCAH